MKAVYELVDKKMIPDQEIGFHRSGGYFKCLYHKGRGKKSYNGGHQKGFEVFSDGRFMELQRWFSNDINVQSPKA